MRNRIFMFTGSESRDIKEKRVDIPAVDNTELRTQLITRIENLTLTILQQICSDQLPRISYHDPSASPTFESCPLEENTNTDQVNKESGKQTVTDFARRRSKDKFNLRMTTIAAVHRLLITNTTITRRSLYYDLKRKDTLNLVRDQRHVDEAVNHVAYLLNCAPWELNLLSTSKGLAAGNLTLTLIDNRTIDFSAPGGVLIPQIPSNVISISTKARIVLVVEKDAVFQKLLEDDCTSQLDCILVTGKGYPDVSTRMLVKLLSEKMELPVYIIVDADPFGVEIMCVYRFGSATLWKENESLACSNVRWLGVHPSELLGLGVSTIPLTEVDLSKLAGIKSRSYMTEAMLKELEIMKTGKAEIENVSSFSGKFLTATYFPSKIKGGDYI